MVLKCEAAGRPPTAVGVPRPQGRRYSAPAARVQALTVRAALALLVVASPLAAQTITDGDTLKQGGATYRLWGIDAPEAKQVCPDGWPAGSLATTRLQALTAGRSVVCQEKDRDRYGRIVAICRVSGEDLGAILVREGLAGHLPGTASTMLISKKRPASPTAAYMHTIARGHGSGGRSSAQQFVHSW